MNALKRFLSAALAASLILLCLPFGGCSPAPRNDGDFSIICSVFPEYDWLRNIVGDSDGVSLSLLVKNGRELHGYDASPAEIISLKQSDVVISVGGASDGWITEALSSDAPDTLHIKLSEIEGMSSYTPSGHTHGDGHDHSRDLPDEHLWLSPKNAAVACRYICEKLCEADPDGAERYRANTEKYISELSALDSELTRLAAELADKPLVFADRFPFVYMLSDYGIGYHSAIEGCSTDVGWTPETTVAMTALINELSSPCVFVTETSDGELAELVINSSADKNRPVVPLHSMQSVTFGEAEELSYTGIMSDNIAAIRRGFGLE